MKLHLCCGDIYLDGYVNIDIDGIPAVIAYKADLEANKTTLDKYFKYPFEKDPSKRNFNKRPFIVDVKMNILEKKSMFDKDYVKWPFKDNSIDEIVMISCIEHFDPKHELPHILSEITRVLKFGGRLKIDWPDIKKQVLEYIDKDPDFCMELIYCNHKHKYAIHHWGFTERLFMDYLNSYGAKWGYEFTDVVKHDYPMQGCIAIKISK